MDAGAHIGIERTRRGHVLGQLGNRAGGDQRGGEGDDDRQGCGPAGECEACRNREGGGNGGGHKRDRLEKDPREGNRAAAQRLRLATPRRGLAGGGGTDFISCHCDTPQSASCNTVIIRPGFGLAQTSERHSRLRREAAHPLKTEAVQPTGEKRCSHSGGGSREQRRSAAGLSTRLDSVSSVHADCS